MDHSPIRDERILEGLEACRPGSDDVADPALAFLAEAMADDPQLEELYRRLQQTDAALMASFPDVPVPEQIEGRLLRRLAAERRDRGAAVDDESPSPGTTPTKTAGAGRFSRRWLVAVAGSLAVAAALLVVAAIHLVGGEPVGKTAALSGGLDFFKAEAADPPAPGSLVHVVRPPPNHPFSSSLLASRGTRWRWVHGLLGSDAVAYDLPSARGVRATLYVVRRKAAGLSAAAPGQPQETTGGLAVSAWYDDGLLYVLVVHPGSLRSYQSFLDLPSGPLT